MPPVYVAPVSLGLGDLVVSLPVIQSLIASGERHGEETWLVARSPSQAALAERIAGLAGTVSEEDMAPLAPGARLVDLRDHPLQRDFWWGSAAFDEAFGPLDINQILARISADYGIRPDFSRPEPLTACRRPELSGSVLLITETDGPAKAWPAEKWAAVAARLSPPFDVRYVTRSADGGPLSGSGMPPLVAPTPADAVDALSSCRAAIGVDTGLTHIAVQQATPTVVLCRQRSVFFRSWPHVRALRGGPCDEACVAGELAAAYNDRVSLRHFQWKPRECPAGVRCLSVLQPDQAVALLDELL